MSVDTKAVNVLAMWGAAIKKTRERGGYPGLQSLDEGRAAVVELIDKAAAVVVTVLAEGDGKLVKPSAKNANAGFVDLRSWYALKSEVMQLQAALARVQGGAK